MWRKELAARNSWEEHEQRTSDATFTDIAWSWMWAKTFCERCESEWGLKWLLRSLLETKAKAKPWKLRDSFWMKKNLRKSWDWILNKQPTFGKELKQKTLPGSWRNLFHFFDPTNLICVLSSDKISFLFFDPNEFNSFSRSNLFYFF